MRSPPASPPVRFATRRNLRRGPRSMTVHHGGALRQAQGPKGSSGTGRKLRERATPRSSATNESR